MKTSPKVNTHVCREEMGGSKFRFQCRPLPASLPDCSLGCKNTPPWVPWWSSQLPPSRSETQVDLHTWSLKRTTKASTLNAFTNLLPPLAAIAEGTQCTVEIGTAASWVGYKEKQWKEENTPACIHLGLIDAGDERLRFSPFDSSCLCVLPPFVVNNAGGM